MKTKKMMALATNLFFLLTFQACTSSNSSHLVAPAVPVYEEPAYETARCQQMTICDTRTIRFTYQAAQTEALSYSENDIHYSAFFVSPGTTVQEGDLLCELDLENYPDLLSASETTLADLQENRSLIDEHLALSLKRQHIENTNLTYLERQNALDSITLRYSQEKAELEDQIHILKERIVQYQELIQNRQLYAPFDGTITYVYHPDSTELSQTGKKIITLVNTSQMLFTAKTDYSAYFQPDADYTISINGKEKIATVISSDPETGIVALALKIPDYTLEPDIQGVIELLLEEKDLVLGVPKRAISTINGISVVYIRGKDGFRTFQEVKTGIENLSYIEIISGLNEGDEVLLPD